MKLINMVNVKLNSSLAGKLQLQYFTFKLYNLSSAPLFSNIPVDVLHL